MVTAKGLPAKRKASRILTQPNGQPDALAIAFESARTVIGAERIVLAFLLEPGTANVPIAELATFELRQVLAEIFERHPQMFDGLLWRNFGHCQHPGELLPFERIQLAP